MGEAINAFKRTQAEIASEMKKAVTAVSQSSVSAIKNIEKATAEQLKKQESSNKENKNSNNSTLSVNRRIDPEYARAYAKKHAPAIFKGKEYKHLTEEQKEDLVYEKIIESGRAERVTDITIGYGKEPQSWDKGERDFQTLHHKTKQNLIRLVGKEKAIDIMAEYSHLGYDKHTNIQLQHDYPAIMAEIESIKFEQQEEKKAKAESKEIKLDQRYEKSEARRLKQEEERKIKEQLREFRAEFKDTERELEKEERKQVLALKERQQLQAGVAGDLIQGGAGMAMGVALNKPTIIFASLATSAAKVTSRFGKLGKILGVLITALSAGVGIANVLSGRTKDNIKSGARAHISPETANALKEAGDKFLEDPNALIETASRITDWKATISTPIGFSQQLATLGQTGITPILSKIGMNPLQLLNKVNNSTTEELLYWFGEKVLPSIKNDNEQRELANTLGIGRLLEGNIQLSTTFGKKTGIMQEVREIKAEAGQLTAESKYQQYKTAKEGAIAGAKWGINNLTVEKFGGAVEIFYKAVSKFSDLASGGKGNNTRQINAMDNLRNLKPKSIDDLKTTLNNSKFVDRADIFDAFINSDIESNSTAVEYQKLKKAQDQARTLQAQIQNLPKKQQEAQKAKFLNSFITAPIRKVSNESGVTQGVRYESDKPAKNDINFNITLKDQTGNGVVAYSTGGN